MVGEEEHVLVRMYNDIQRLKEEVAYLLDRIRLSEAADTVNPGKDN